MSLESMTYDLMPAPSRSTSPSLSREAARQAALRAGKKRETNTMPDNKGVGWRKKIQSKPKELQPLRPGTDTSTSTDDSGERRRHHGWRKTIQGSRPNTPALPTTPIFDTTESVHVERAESCTPRRDSKPKLIRYTSLFSGFNSTPKSPEFAEPWSEEPPSFEPYVDPAVAIASIRAHMDSFSMKPIPLEHSSNLFRIFEDYHKRRCETERLDAALQDMCEKLDRAESQRVEDERQYAAEIRRLELLIAKGATGVAGLLNARQGSVLDRTRRHRKTISNSRPTTWNSFLTQEQIDTEIKARSQQVLLQRSTSPSMKMAALSRHFTGTDDADLCVGTPPLHETKPMLSRKVQSELNLNTLDRVDTASHSSVASGFSGGPGDTLPDEMPLPTPTLVEMTVDCDATIALRELGTLVARKRGLNAATFVEGLMALLSPHNSSDQDTKRASSYGKHDLDEDDASNEKLTVSVSTPRRTLRRFQSQPQLNSDQKRRRHFSFEPGEDLLQSFKEELTETVPSPLCDSSPEMSRQTVVNTFSDAGMEMSPRSLGSIYSGTRRDSGGISKIPSPVQVYGSVRREGSVSSMQSVIVKSADGRHNSQSSILTAFRENQSASLRPSTNSRSSSFNTLHSAEMSPACKDGREHVRVRNSASSLSADHPTSVSQRGSPVRITAQSWTTSSLGAARFIGQATREKDQRGSSS